MDDSAGSIQEDLETIYEIANNITKFALRLNKFLYISAAQHEKNLIFSPINIYSALALLHLAADGKSRDELADEMGLSKDKDKIQQIHDIISLTLETIESSKAMDICTSKKIFLQNGLNIVQSYVSQLRTFYNGEICHVDFQNDSQQVTDKINHFISRSTEDKNAKFLQFPISSNTSILFASCLCFRAKWDKPFYQTSTKMENFNAISRQIPTIMMSRQDYVPYINLIHLQLEAISIHFSECQVSTFYLLPYPNRPLDDLVLYLHHSTLQRIVRKSQLTYVDIKIPQMKYKCSHNIADPLAQLAIKEIFSGHVDLNMVDGTKQQYARVIHAAEIQIDENIQQEDKRRSQHIVKSIPFHVDRPFLFFIYDHLTGAILFLGVVHNPNMQE